MYTDGGARGNPGPAGAGAYAVTTEGREIFRLKRFLGEITNNQAEYHALIMGLSKLKVLRYKEVDVRMDSELVVRQLNGQYKVKEPTIKQLFVEVQSLTCKFHEINFRHISRSENTQADRLVNEAIDEHQNI